MQRIMFALSLFMLVTHASAKTKEIVHVTTPIEISIGSTTAPVTIVEYTSATCHHCADFHLKVFPKIKEKYVNTGKVRFVIMPYVSDSYALQAFKLITALPPEKRNLGLIKTLGSQERWIGKSPETLGKILGLSALQCKKALANNDVENALLTCAYKGQKDLDIDATPTFFFNGEKVEGAPSFEDFEKTYAKMTQDSAAIS